MTTICADAPGNISCRSDAEAECPCCGDWLCAEHLADHAVSRPISDRRDPRRHRSEVSTDARREKGAMSTAEKEWEHRESDSNDLASLEREFAARFTPPLESPIQTTTGETEAAEQYRLMEIEDGTRWPNPHDGDFAWRLVHGGEPSRGDVLRAVTAWEAYRALTTHPAGTKAMQRKLAMIRRRAKETSR